MMPSGWFGTADINSIYNSWLNRTCFKSVMKDFGLDLKFNDVAKLAVLGDDLLKSLHMMLDGVYTADALAKKAKELFQLHMTPADKTASFKMYYPLESLGWDPSNAQFLKRQFLVRSGIVFPILDIESIHAMTLYVRPTPDLNRDMATKQNIETALRELAYYGRETFEKYKTYYQNFYYYKRWGMIDLQWESLIAKYLS
jgi:hypothetical protein